MYRAVHLEFDQLTQAGVDADDAKARQVTAQARHGILGILKEIKANLQRKVSGGQNRGLLSLKRTLLGQQGACAKEQHKGKSPTVKRTLRGSRQEHG
jgi:hypothetical protein